MNVEPVALRGLQQPVARQVVAVVTGETGRGDAAHGDVLHQSSAGGWQEEQVEQQWEIPLHCYVYIVWILYYVLNVCICEYRG